MLESALRVTRPWRPLCNSQSILALSPSSPPGVSTSNLGVTRRWFPSAEHGMHDAGQIVEHVDSTGPPQRSSSLALARLSSPQKHCRIGLLDCWPEQVHQLQDVLSCSVQ